MNITKLAAALVLGALALAPMAQSSQATGSAPGSGVRAPSGVAAGEPPLVQGVVSDQFGSYVDDVQVDATRANGKPAASALTYASARDGGPQHGYFFLEVGKLGVYDLTLSKAGYVTVEVEGVEISRLRQKLALGELSIVRKLADTRISAQLQDGTVAPTQRAKVDVSVSGKASRKPTGDVEVRDGNRVVGSATLVAGTRGDLTVTLRKLARGDYNLKAYFLGSRTLKRSVSRGVDLTVRKPRHRPSAW